MSTKLEKFFTNIYKRVQKLAEERRRTILECMFIISQSVFYCPLILIATSLLWSQMEHFSPDLNRSWAVNIVSLSFLRWRRSFFISVTFGFPVIMILIYGIFGEREQTTVIPGLSLQNLLLFACCTPIQVSVNCKYLFYTLAGSCSIVHPLMLMRVTCKHVSLCTTIRKWYPPLVYVLKQRCKFGNSCVMKTSFHCKWQCGSDKPVGANL